MAVANPKKVSLPTKADEIAHLREFIASLPEASYLHSCLAPFAAEFERDVYSDFIPSFSESWSHRVEARHEAVEAAKELKAIQDQIQSAKQELASQASRLHRIQDSLCSLRSSVEQAVVVATAASDKAHKLI